MYTKARSGRDAFAFSLRGLTTIAPFVAPPVVDDNRINIAWDQRLQGVAPHRPSTIEVIEDLLGRYFAAGYCGGL